MMRPVPAPGYRLISGKRKPPANSKGYWVQARCGWCDMLAPWPAKGPRWIWGDTPDDWDVAAVKPAN
jgi:hypothetical protein